MNRPNKFAFFRGLFWQVKWSQFLNVWQPPIRYPVSNHRGVMRRDRPYVHDATYMRLPEYRLPYRIIFGDRDFGVSPIALILRDYYRLRDIRRERVNWQREGF
jgi:hypothetical protein